MSTIRVTLWIGENEQAVKLYGNTLGEQVIALSDAEYHVGTCPSRTAHIVLAGTHVGIYIVRHTDENQMPDFTDRLTLLRASLAKQERGY